MKIYFIASPRALDKDGPLLRSAYDFLAKDNKMLSDLIIKLNKNSLDEFYSAPHKERIRHFKKTMNCVKEAELVVVEISIHSMSMGYIVNRAMELGKPVIVLYKKGFAPHFFSGIQNERLQKIEYQKDNLFKVLKKAINVAKNQVDVRFNFFVTPRILAYLDWLSRRKRIPRAVYLRSLIEKDMKYDKDYQKETSIK